MRKRKLTLTLACMLALTAMAQSKLDSVQHVREIIVVSKPAMREVVPSQKLKGELLEQLNTHSVADALRYFSGIQLKDYGGVGGIKTVNIRSMGTHHLGISYDGVQLGNAQNGQIDLGQFISRYTTDRRVLSSNPQATLAMLAPSISAPKRPYSRKARKLI